ncbi:MAG: glycosyltransferase [Sulfuritalea sp.]|nr:glycosyltransferase [Sulfuritalea sp.]
MAELDVLVVPSLWHENSPLVIYSAQAARCPVIGSDVEGIAEVVRDDVDGLLFQRGNVAALMQTLLRVTGRSELLET